MTRQDEATRKQIRAAQPGRSAWVAANAGSGKTRVLTDRVARLLLRGTLPERILCLTFTKAAASEMQNRLYKRLGEWAMMPEDKLLQELASLGEDTVNIDVRAARTLFASAIETPGGLKIQTIHAFCDRLLKQFPLEAGVPAQFETLDDRAAIELHEDVMNALARDPNSETDIQAFLAHVLREDLSPILQPLLEAPAAARVMADLEIEEFGYQAVLTNADRSLLDTIKPHLASGGNNDQKAIPKLERLLTAHSFEDQLDAAISLLLTGVTAKTPFSPNGFPTKAVKTTSGINEGQLDNLKSRIFDLRDAYADHVDRIRCRALGRFAKAFLNRLDQEKAARGVLEYSDLIARAKALLTRSDMAQWVLYKLDGGIDHILVDEAQDTSQDQWDIVEALTEDFMSGETEETDRSLFVVGDAKQSIYSFQGASPTAFSHMRGRFKDKLDAIGQDLWQEGLLHSFRSSRAVLNLVDTVFGGQAGGQFSEDIEHIPWDSQKPGRVELWPYREAEEAAEEPAWFEPLDMPPPSDPRLGLAADIAQRVKDLTSGETLITVGKETRSVQPGDILILVQRRRLIFNAILSELKSRDIPVAGADRLRISEELGVKDILSLLKFLNLAEDDLSLAEVLRSPLCGLSEKDLFTLAHNRSGSLWQSVRTNEAYAETTGFLQDMRDRADFLRPYELIEHCLTHHKGRENMLARLGREVEDALNELLAQALIFEQNAVPDLANFVHWFEGGDVEIKRDLDSAKNEVRIMTIHGAKGLEAPIVILPETGPKRGNSNTDDLRKLDDGSLIWPNAHPFRHRPHFDALAHLSAQSAEEDKRLLYVALTRAKSWLIIAGAGAKLSATSKSPCWYQLVDDAFNRLELPAKDSGSRLIENGTWSAKSKMAPKPATQSHVLPKSILDPAPKSPAQIKALKPSDAAGPKTLTGTEDDADAMRRGTLLHELLEILSATPEDKKEAVGTAIVKDFENGPALIKQAIVLLSDPNLNHVFSNAQFEVPFSVPYKTTTLEGIFDLLKVTDDTVQITDFKSNSLVPETPDQTPIGLIGQLALYHHAAQTLFPDHKISCAILWTQTGTLMGLPEHILTDTIGNISVA